MNDFFEDGKGRRKRTINYKNSEIRMKYVNITREC